MTQRRTRTTRNSCSSMRNSLERGKPNKCRPIRGAWHRADRGIVTVTGVSQWNDLFGLGRHQIQASTPRQPVWNSRGRGSIIFDGADDAMQALFTMAQPTTVFFVYKFISGGGGSGVNDGIYDGGSVAAMIMLEDATPRTYINAGSSITFSGLIANGIFEQTCAIFSGSGGQLHEGRTLRVAGNVGTSAPNGFTIGCIGNGTRCTNIEVREAIIITTSAWVGLRNRIQNYLRARYGLNA